MLPYVASIQALSPGDDKWRRVSSKSGTGKAKLFAIGCNRQDDHFNWKPVIKGNSSTDLIVKKPSFTLAGEGEKKVCQSFRLQHVYQASIRASTFSFF
jgi:hypothetical protein